MIRRVILHCGAHKTGTTTVQSHLWENRNILTEKGIFYCPLRIKHGDIDPLNKAILNLCSASQVEAVQAGRERLEYLFGERKYHTVIVSNENAFDAPFSDKGEGFYPFLESRLAGLQEMFVGCQVEPLFFVRSYAGLLPSFFIQTVRQGSIDSLQGFVERVGQHDMSWQRLVRKVSDTFGAQHLHLHTFESFSQSPSVYTEDLWKALLDIDCFPVHGFAHKNKSANRHAVYAMRVLNKAILALPFLTDTTRKKMQFKIRRLFFPKLEKLRTGGRVALPKPVADKLDLQYQSDLKALQPWLK